jgi:hypothetical protein
VICLFWIKAHGRDIAERADGFAFVCLPVLLGRVLNDEQPVLAREGGHGIHIDRQAIDVHHHDRLSMAGNFGSDQHGIDVPRIGLAIDYNWHSASPRDGRGTRYNSEARKNDLIARPNAQRRQRHINRGAAVAHRNAMRASH